MILINFVFVTIELFMSPRFNNNYIIESSSLDGKFKIVSVPFHCANDGNGCVKVVKNNKLVYFFSVNNLVGNCYVAIDNSDIVLEVPLEIGRPRSIYTQLSLSQIEKNNSIIRIYKRGVLLDSIKVPLIHPSRFNENRITTKGQVDRSKILHYKKDTLALVTNNATSLIYLKNDKINIINKRNINAIKYFKRLKLNVYRKCFSYSQSYSCEIISHSVKSKKRVPKSMWK